MSDKTGIQWTDATWNPVRGCSRVSEGCRNCYAEAVAHRFSGAGQPYEGLARRVNGHASWTGEVRFIAKHLRDPRMTYIDPESELRVYGRVVLADKKGGDWDEWPQDLRVREFPA